MAKKSPRRGASPHQKFAKEVVDGYLECCRQMHQLAYGRFVFDDGPAGLDQHHIEQAGREMLAQLRSARLFMLEPEQMRQLMVQAQKHVCEHLGGVTWRRPGRVRTADPLQRSARLRKIVQERGVEAPPVERLPFATTFVGYGERLLLRSYELSAWTARWSRRKWSQARGAALLGHVMWKTGRRFNAVTLVDVDFEDRSNINPFNSYCEDRWWCPLSLEPWYLPLVVDAINSHISVVHEQTPTLGQRLDFRDLSRELDLRLPPPKPYYVVTLRSKLVVQRAERALPRVTRRYRHRHDVRGHERCYVQRGRLPLSPERAALLRRRGYQLYLERTPRRRDRKRLRRRFMPPKGPGEWLAIKTVWIDECVRPADPALPYVPALRRLP